MKLLIMKILLLFVCFLFIVAIILLNRFECRQKKIKQFLYKQCLNSNVYLKQSNVGGKYGRGVFANKDFTKDEIIELAPYIEGDTTNMIGIVRDYVFGKGANGLRSVIAFGYASLYNHSDTPSAIWNVDDSYVIIKALKPIKKDDEILVSYGDGYWRTRTKNQEQTLIKQTLINKNK
jgi:hypothetical protein